MLTLDSTLKSLEVVLGGAVTTNELPITISWTKKGGKGNPYNQNQTSNMLTTGATPVTVVAAPARAYKHIVEYITIFNADTAAVDATVQLNVDGDIYEIVSFTIASGFSLVYTDEEGWQLLSGSGALNTTEALSSPLPIESGGTGAITAEDALAALGLQEGAIVKLATVDAIDATSTGDTELYTVPALKSAVLTGVSIRVTDFTAGAKAVQAVASVGANITFDDYLNSVTYTVAASDVVILDNVLNTAVPVYAAADAITLTVETASDADVEVWSVDLFGYLI